MSTEERSRKTTEPRPGYRQGVGVVLVNGDGLVFAAKRIDTPGDHWQLPQGGIDPGETPEEAIFRELEEETGIHNAELVAAAKHWISYDLPKDIAGRVWNGNFAGQTQKWMVLRFLGKDSDIDLATEHPEFNDWKWVPLRDLPGMIIPFKRRLYEDIVEEFADVVDAI